MLKRPEVDYQRLVDIKGIGPGVEDEQISQQLEIQARYSGYLGRQQEDIAQRRSHETMKIGDDFDFSGVRGLSAEVREKLQSVRPDTIGQASRVPGVTPVAISLLLVHLKKSHKLRVQA